MHSAEFGQAAGIGALGAPIKVIAIAGGKGGVGKTNVAVNLGTALCRMGRRVLLLDADLGLANVDVVLGVRARLNLEHVIAGDCGLEDVIVTAPSGLKIVPASSGNAVMANLGRSVHGGLIQAFSDLIEPLDVLLIDTAAGLSDSVLTFGEAAQRIAVVVCDEPAALTDAYGLIKALRRRRPGMRIDVISNMVDGESHGRALYGKLARVTERFLGFVPAYQGSIPRDEYLRRAVQRQVAVVEGFPGSVSARAFMRLAQTVDGWQAPSAPNGGLEFFVERMLGGRANRVEQAG
jgi:flagellar biosynthesis protein FlhG